MRELQPRPRSHRIQTSSCPWARPGASRAATRPASSPTAPHRSMVIQAIAPPSTVDTNRGPVCRHAQAGRHDHGAVLLEHTAGAGRRHPADAGGRPMSDCPIERARDRLLAMKARSGDPFIRAELMRAIGDLDEFRTSPRRHLLGSRYVERRSLGPARPRPRFVGERNARRYRHDHARRLPPRRRSSVLSAIPLRG
jgi:hypothetical protein